MSKKLQDYKFMIETNSIELSRGFEDRLNSGDTSAQLKLRKLEHDYPNWSIERKPVRHRTTKTQVSYTLMKKYISCLQNSNEWMFHFDVMREASRAQPSPYNYVRDWFMQHFPAYREQPEMDQEGRIIVNKPEHVANLRVLEGDKEDDEIA